MKLFKNYIYMQNERNEVNVIIDSALTRNKLTHYKFSGNALIIIDNKNNQYAFPDFDIDNIQKLYVSQREANNRVVMREVSNV